MIARLVLAAWAAVAVGDFPLKDGQRVVFLGDSNTYAGGYVREVDAFLASRFPDRTIEVLNLGLPSETASGLSEPEHPYPRPDVHERLARVLARTKPDVVVACYGMNDGIYYPFDEGRFAAYRRGIETFREKVEGAGAALVLITPPPFDAVPVADKVLPADAGQWSWMRPFSGYDGVLGRYSGWLLTLRGDGLRVADAHTAIDRHLAAVRATDPAYRVAGDGVHVDADGHALIALELLRAWDAPEEADAAEIDAGAPRATRGRIEGLAREGRGLKFQWTSRLPLPPSPRRIGDPVNRYRLKVVGLPAGTYRLSEGDHALGEVDRDRLAEGLDLLAFPELSTVRRAGALRELVERRERLLGPAWLSDVGHRRPDTPAGMPLDEARRQAAGLSAEIRKVAAPAPISLRLEPIGG